MPHSSWDQFSIICSNEPRLYNENIYKKGTNPFLTVLIVLKFRGDHDNNQDSTVDMSLMAFLEAPELLGACLHRIANSSMAVS